MMWKILRAGNTRGGTGETILHVDLSTAEARQVAAEAEPLGDLLQSLRGGEVVILDAEGMRAAG